MFYICALVNRIKQIVALAFLLISLWLSLPKNYLHVFSAQNHIDASACEHHASDCSLCNTVYVVFDIAPVPFYFANLYAHPYNDRFFWTDLLCAKSYFVYNGLSPPYLATIG
jgi:hypothetical protein